MTTSAAPIIRRTTLPEANRELAERNDGIDALRGLSILLVILNHVGIRIPLKKTALATFVPAQVLSDLNYNGYEAVFIFFVISGFLITRGALERWGNPRAISLRDFYLRRGSRILPCLIALVAVLSLLHLFGAQDYTIKHANQSLPQAICAALGLYLNWYEGATGYLPGSWDVLWSLSIEEVFYLGFPLLCLLCGGTRWFVALLVALALSMPFTHAAAQGNEIWQEKAYLPGMSAIAVGILAALIAHAAVRPTPRTAATLRLTGIAGILTILFAGRWIWLLLRDGYLLVLTFSAAILVLGMHWNARRGLPALGWLRSCGRLSYEIYLTHMFCVLVIVAIARASPLDSAWGFVWYPLAIGTSWLLGFAVAQGFSQPCERRWRRALAQQPSVTPIAAPAPLDV